MSEQEEKKEGEIDTAFIIGCTPTVAGPVDATITVEKPVALLQRALGSSARLGQPAGQLPFSVRGIISRGRSQPAESQPVNSGYEFPLFQLADPLSLSPPLSLCVLV